MAVDKNGDNPPEEAVVFDLGGGEAAGMAQFAAAIMSRREMPEAGPWFFHCGRPGRDRTYRTISASSVTKTLGASTNKISRHTSMRSPVVGCPEL